VLPELYGVGYPVLEHAIQGHYLAGFLLVLLAGKLLATSLTIAIGGSGGVFAPSLFMGAMLGTAYGLGMGHLFPHVTGPAGAYGLVGMGAVFAGAARAPITAVLIIFELTGEYSIILPLMAAIVLASGISRLLTGDTIYTLKLHRRGINLAHAQPDSPLERLRVADAMRSLPTPLETGTSLRDTVARLSEVSGGALPVVDSTGALRGVVTAAEAEQAVQDHGPFTAADLARTTTVLQAEMTLQQALTELVRQHDSGLPVVAATADGRLVGWLDHRDVLRALATHGQ
jgi:CIC family chloride channel protein